MKHACSPDVVDDGIPALLDPWRGEMVTCRRNESWLGRRVAAAVDVKVDLELQHI